MSARDGRRCGACFFYTPHPAVLGTGQCIHSPPTAVVVGGGVTSMFPPVQADNYCGQYQARDQVAEQGEGRGNGRILEGANDG